MCISAASLTCSWRVGAPIPAPNFLSVAISNCWASACSQFTYTRAISHDNNRLKFNNTTVVNIQLNWTNWLISLDTHTGFPFNWPSILKLFQFGMGPEKINFGDNRSRFLRSGCLSSRQTSNVQAHNRTQNTNYNHGNQSLASLSTHVDMQGVDIAFTVCLFFVFCTVTDFFADDKASGIKCCTAVHQRQRQGISHFCELCSPRSSKSNKSASARATPTGM